MFMTGKYAVMIAIFLLPFLLLHSMSQVLKNNPWLFPVGIIFAPYQDFIFHVITLLLF